MQNTFTLFKRPHPEPVSYREEFGWSGSSSAHVLDEVPSQLQKARLEFTNLRHPWYWRDIWLSIKGRIRTVAIRSVTPYGSKAWVLRKDMSEHCFLLSICRTNEDRFIIHNLGARYRILIHYWEAVLNSNLLRLLGQLLCVPTECSSHCALFFDAGSLEDGCMWSVGDLGNSMKTLTNGLAWVGPVRLPSCDPWNLPKGWLVIGFNFAVTGVLEFQFAPPVIWLSILCLTFHCLVSIPPLSRHFCGIAIKTRARRCKFNFSRKLDWIESGDGELLSTIKITHTSRINASSVLVDKRLINLLTGW